MQIKEFEKILQDEVSSKFNFREHPVNKDILGVYYGDVYAEFSVPNNEIFEERNENYLDLFGVPHRGSKEAMEIAKGFHDKFENDAEWREDFLAEI